MTGRLQKGAGWALAAGAGALSVLLSESSFYLSSGSDAAVAVYTPPVWAKLISYTLFLALTSAALFAQSAGWLSRGVLATVAVLLLAIGNHALVFNNKRGIIEDFWLFGAVDRATYDIADGISMDWTVERTLGGFRLRHKQSRETVLLLCGLPPWWVDPAAELGL